MLNKIKAYLQHSDGRHAQLVFQQRSVPLYSQIISAGIQRVATTDYDWNGKRRGAAEFALIQYTLSGAGRLSYEGREFHPRPGQAMLLTFPHENRYRFTGPAPWEFIYAVLAGREIIRLWREIIRRQGPLIRLPTSSRACQALAGLALNVLEGRILSPFQSSAAAYSLAMTLHDELIVLPEQSDTLPPGIQAAKQYCREHIRDNLNVADLAAVSGCSRYHFSRVFKKWTGLAPAQYVQDLRLRHAMQLLMESQARVKHTAYASGFRDYNYFCRAFRRHFGVSPGRVKKSGMY